MNGLVKYVSILLRFNKVGHFKTVLKTPKLCEKLYSTTPHSYTVKKLQELFNYKHSTASNIILDHKSFTKVTSNEIDKVFKSCIEAGVNKETIEKNVEVLTVSEVDEKIKYLTKLPYSLNITLPLLLINEKLLKKLVEQEISEKRIKFLSILFEVKCNPNLNIKIEIFHLFRLRLM